MSQTGLQNRQKAQNSRKWFTQSMFLVAYTHTLHTLSALNHANNCTALPQRLFVPFPVKKRISTYKSKYYASSSNTRTAQYSSIYTCHPQRGPTTRLYNVQTSGEAWGHLSASVPGRRANCRQESARGFCRCKNEQLKVELYLEFVAVSGWTARYPPALFQSNTVQYNCDIFRKSHPFPYALLDSSCKLFVPLPSCTAQPQCRATQKDHWTTNACLFYEVEEGPRRCSTPAGKSTVQYAAGLGSEEITYLWLKHYQMTGL